MKKNIYYLLFFLPIMVMLAGCGDESQLRPDESGVLLTISSVSTNSEKKISAISTRSVTPLTSGSIGIFRLSSSDYTAQTNLQYTYGSAWTSVTQMYLTSKTASICAYYPYSETIGDDPVTTGTVEGNDPAAIPLVSQIYSSAADLCYAGATPVYSGSPNANFTMNRAYAQMLFLITHDASYTGACAISNIKIINAGIRSSNTLNLFTGAYGATAANGSVTFNPAIASIASAGITTTKALIVPTISGTTPETLTGNMTFEFTVDGKPRVATLPVSTNNLTTLTPGFIYRINVKISGSGMSLALATTAGSGSINLDATHANCYVVAPSASKTIVVNIKGNGGDVAGTGLSTTHTATSVGIIWQSAANLITLGTFDATDQTVVINANTSATSGNAVIAAYSGAGETGTILWSWHIWVTDYHPNSGIKYTITNTASASYTFMDRNLGATTNMAGDVAVKGLMYQWGRKDPFPGSTTLDGTTEPTTSNGFLFSSKITAITKTPAAVGPNLANSILYPSTFYCGTDANNYDWYSLTNPTHNDALWGGANTTSPTNKTIFDPCPAGWRVPAWDGGASPWSAIGIDGVSTSSVGAFSNFGVIWSIITVGFWPATGVQGFTDGAFNSIGSSGNYWSASSHSGDGNGYCFSFSSSTVTPTNYFFRARGSSIRCVQE